MLGRIKSIGLFLVACITSPCCTPIIVPLALAAIAGTPAAAWIGARVGWVYGALTLVSIVSLVLAVRQINGRRAAMANKHTPGSDELLGAQTERIGS